MAISKTLWGTVRSIPQTDEENWGDTLTNLHADTADGLDTITGLAGTTPVPISKSSALSLAAGGTIPSAGGTVTKAVYYVSGNGGAVTLGSIAIANGSVDGQMVRIIGTSDTNTVTINHGSNTTQNGDITLSADESILFIWKNSASLWKEVNRST